MAQAGGVDDYEGAVEGLAALGSSLCNVIGEMLLHGGVTVHSVTARVKTRDSAARKFTGNPEKYAAHGDLTDLLGVRVITYFSDEVDKAAKTLIPEFDIDLANSVDKRAALRSDQFGYLSLHYIAALSQKRLRLVEYSRFVGMRFELQIRSILQHAWAEIEHDLGYKADGGLPDEMRRRFSRLAGLLELADDEFVRLRLDLDEYERSVPDRIADSPESLDVNQATLTTLLETDTSLVSLDEAISAAFPATLSDEASSAYASARADSLRSLGIVDVATLLRIVAERSEHAVTFARLWLSPEEDRNTMPGTVPRGIGLFYVEYTLMAHADAATINKWLVARSIRANTDEDLGTRIKEVWDAVVDELGSPPPWPG